MEKKVGTTIDRKESQKTVDAIVSAGIADLKTSVIRLALMDTMRKRGVPFANLKSVIIKDHKICNVYRKVWDAKKNKMTFRDFNFHLNANEKWAHDIRRTCNWIKSEYEAYGAKKKAKVLTVADKKNKELKKITDAWKVISNLFCDTEDDNVKEAMANLDTVIKAMERKG